MVDEITKLCHTKKRYKNEQTNKYESRYYTYQEILTSLFKKYIEILKTYSHRDDNISLWEEKDIKTYVNDKITLSLKWLLHYYMSGNIIESNKCANRLFNVTANRLSAAALFPKVTIKKDSFWYRARKPEPEPFKRKDLFHVPFEKREMIGTNRYSIPGYPCLYLASTMECAREETGNIYIAAVSCFQNSDDMEAYDFTFFPQRDKEDWASLYNDIMTYPFKIAASIPTIPPEDGGLNGPFKEEYIIPQLLLHCVIRQAGNRELALLYSSVKSIYAGIPKNEYHKHVNLVVPALSFCLEGYCQRLMNKFKLTEPQIIPFSYLNKEQINELESKMKNEEMNNLI